MRASKIIFINLFVILLLTEIGLYFFDFPTQNTLSKPYYSNKVEITELRDSENIDHTGFMWPDTNLIWKLRDGNFSVIINDSVRYKSSQKDNKRVTVNYSDSIARKKYAFLGCSFTNGMGVNDSSTFAFMTDKFLNDIDVDNYGLPGSSTLHSLELLESKIAINQYEKIFYFYIPHHDNRNSLLYSTRTSNYFSLQPHLHKYDSLLHTLNLNRQQVKYKYGELTEDSLLSIKALSYHQLYKNVPFSKNSRVAYCIEQWMNKDSEKQKNSANELTYQIIKKMDLYSKANGAIFYFVNLGVDEKAYFILEKCKQNNIQFIRMNINLDSDSLRLYPYDQHPNELAHQLIAYELAQKILFLPQ